MGDPRIRKLADILVGYSCAVRPGECVSIGAMGAPPEMICALIERIADAGGLPFVQITDPRVTRTLYMHATPEQMEILARRDLGFQREMCHYIGVVGEMNAAEMSDVPSDKLQIVQEHWSRRLQEYWDKHGSWVIMRWPTPAAAQRAGMSTEAYQEYYFDACILDYEKLARAAEPLRDRVMSADIVRIVGGSDTDLTFSIKGVDAMISAGKHNIPDGEVATSPVKESVNGVIHFNTGTFYHGRYFDDIRLVFRDGRVVEATSSNTHALNDILDADEGARFVGEFSFGLNPRVDRPMRDIIFDEKIAGSLHLTPGESCDGADNGNRSQVHWDMVLIQTPEFGGGDIYFDDELIRRSGRFVPTYLQGINPENLL